MVSLHKWKIKTFNFVQAFPQAHSETELFISVPKGCYIGRDNEKWCLKVVNNIYGQKQAGRVWCNFLTVKMINIKDDSVIKDIPVLSTKILCWLTKSISFNEPWFYRSVIGQLNYLETSNSP
jgi:hypothetical protein